MTDFIQLVKERRSASNYQPEYKITRQELDEIFQLVALGPSAFNLQHSNYIVIMDPVLKEKLHKASNHQYKVLTSSAVIILLGDRQAYQQTSKIYEGLLTLGVINKQEFDHIVNDTISLYESRGEPFQQEEAIRNASLSAMLFMLAAKEKGWDTCPMIGFEPDEVRQILNIEFNYEIVMMITIGKEKISSRRPRGYRKPVNEFVTYV